MKSYCKVTGFYSKDSCAIYKVASDGLATIAAIEGNGIWIRETTISDLTNDSIYKNYEWLTDEEAFLELL